MATATRTASIDQLYGRAFNPLRMSDLGKLANACQWSMRMMKKQKESRMAAIRQYVGHHYSEDGAIDKVPLNMINLHVDTLQRHINSDAAKLAVSSPFREYAQVADDIEIAADFVMGKCKTNATYQKMGVEAMFGPAICKVGLPKGGRRGSLNNFPFVKMVPFQHYVMDMANPADIEDVEYMGNRYRVPLIWAKENTNYKKSARENLAASDRYTRGDEGDVNPEDLSRGGSYAVEEYTDHVDLWDIWLPLEQLLITVSAENPDVLLSVVEWEGPERGPYHMLGFGYVPGNVLPLAPMHLSLDMHLLINELFNKAGRQALDQKTVLGYSMQAMDDAERLVQIGDGGSLPMNDPSGIKEYKFNGADPGTTGLVLYLRDLYSYAAGNLDLLGGLGTSSETLGQDRLLAASSNQKIVHMQEKMAELQTNVGSDICWYLWNDPELNLPLKKKIAGTDVEIPFLLTPERLKGDYFSLNFKVDPYKLSSRSPSEKLQAILEYVTALAPILERGGCLPKAEEMVTSIAKFAHIPEFADMWNFQSGFVPPQGDPVAPTGKANGAEYIHRSIPSASRAGKERTMAETLLSGSAQPKETASLARPSSR